MNCGLVGTLAPIFLESKCTKRRCKEVWILRPEIWSGTIWPNAISYEPGLFFPLKWLICFLRAYRILTAQIFNLLFMFFCEKNMTDFQRTWIWLRHCWAHVCTFLLPFWSIYLLMEIVKTRNKVPLFAQIDTSICFLTKMKTTICIQESGIRYQSVTWYDRYWYIRYHFCSDANWIVLDFVYITNFWMNFCKCCLPVPLSTSSSMEQLCSNLETGPFYILIVSCAMM